GRNGEYAFESMVRGAVAADPVLKALLMDMGLISEGADGTITIHMPGADEAMSDIDRLTVAMVTLADLMDDGELNGSINMEVLGLDEVEQAKQDLENMPARKDITVRVLGEGPDV